MMKTLLFLAEWIRRHYQGVIISAVAFGLVLGIWTAAPGQFLQNYSQIFTFMMILFISFMIKPRQFLLFRRQPVSVLAGLALNFLWMPLLCWGLARLFVSDTQLALGVILVGVVPCAGMAAVWTALLKADVPLGMAINGLTMLVAPVAIPVLMFVLAGSQVSIDPWKMFQQTAFLLLLPLTLGVLARWWADKKWNTSPFLPLMPALSAIMAVLLMFGITNVNLSVILAQWDLVPPLLAALIPIFPLGFLVPYWLGKKVKWETRIAVTFASGMKNLPLAVGIAFASFPKLVGLPVALAMILQMITASLFYRYLNRASSDRKRGMLDETN